MRVGGKYLLMLGITQLICFAPLAAHAEYCIVDTAQPGECVEVTISCSSDVQSASDEYGTSIGSLCGEIHNLRQEEIQCQQNFIASQDEYAEQSISSSVERDLLFKKVARLTIRNRRLQRQLRLAAE